MATPWGFKSLRPHLASARWQKAPSYRALAKCISPGGTTPVPPEVLARWPEGKDRLRPPRCGKTFRASLSGELRFGARRRPHLASRRPATTPHPGRPSPPLTPPTPPTPPVLTPAPPRAAPRRAKPYGCGSHTAITVSLPHPYGCGSASRSGGGAGRPDNSKKAGRSGGCGCFRRRGQVASGAGLSPGGPTGPAGPAGLLGSSGPAGAGAAKQCSRAGASSGSARTRTSSPAWRAVSPATGSSVPSLITRLTQAFSPQGRSATVAPSAAEPGAT